MINIYCMKFTKSEIIRFSYVDMRKKCLNVVCYKVHILNLCFSHLIHYNIVLICVTDLCLRLM